MVAKAMSLPIKLKAQILKDSSDPVLPEVVFNSLIDALEKASKLESLMISSVISCKNS